MCNVMIIIIIVSLIVGYLVRIFAKIYVINIFISSPFDIKSRSLHGLSNLMHPLCVDFRFSKRVADCVYSVH